MLPRPIINERHITYISGRMSGRDPPAREHAMAAKKKPSKPEEATFVALALVKTYTVTGQVVNVTLEIGGALRAGNLLALRDMIRAGKADPPMDVRVTLEAVPGPLFDQGGK